MEGRDRGRGEQEPQRSDRQMPTPENMALQGRIPPEIHEKDLTDIIIPTQEQAMRKGTGLVIRQATSVIKAQLTAEKIAERAKKTADKASARGVQKVAEAVMKNPEGVAKAGSLAVGPMAYVATEIATEYLDTTLADTLGTIGGVHFAAAKEHLDDARNASTEAGKRTHRERAAGQLSAAYQFREEELSQREGKVLPKKAQIAAHREATNAAILLALINRHNPDTQEAVEKWANKAQEHIEEYVILATDAANNGKKLSKIGELTAYGVDSTPAAYLNRKLLGNDKQFPLVHKAREKFDHHQDTITELAEERREFDELYDLLVPREIPILEQEQMTRRKSELVIQHATDILTGQSGDVDGALADTLEQIKEITITSEDSEMPLTFTITQEEIEDAQEDFKDAQHAETDEEKRAHRERATQGLKSVYEKRKTIIGTVALPEDKQIESLCETTNIALILAVAAKQNSGEEETVTRWANAAKEDFETYERIVKAGKPLAKIAEKGVVPALVIDTLLLPFRANTIDKETDLFPLSHKVMETTSQHTQASAKVKQEKPAFDQLYTLLVPQEDERRTLPQ